MACPAVGVRNVARIRSVVVLPAPLEPMNPNRSPLYTVRSSELSATIWPYVRVRPIVWTAACGGAGVLMLLILHHVRDAQQRVFVRTPWINIVDYLKGQKIKHPGQHHDVAALDEW